MASENQTYSVYSTDHPKLFNSKLSRTMQNMNKSLLSFPPIRNYNEGVVNIRENVTNEWNVRPISYQCGFKWHENSFKGDSSASFWRRNHFYERNSSPRDDFLQNSSNIPTKFTAEALQARLKSKLVRHIDNEQLQNTLVQPHRSFSGFVMNQSDGERNNSQDSTTKEKRKLTRQYLVTVFSICYAIFLVVFGTIVFIDDVVESKYPIPQVFCIYMLLVAFAFFLYFYIDIRLHVHHARKDLKQRTQRKQLIEEYIVNVLMENNGSNNSLNELKVDEAIYIQAARELNFGPLENVSHRYCFTSGQHGDSFYLKLGASWFAFGLVVYSALQCSYDAYFISSNGNYLYECASYMTLALNILFPIYSLFSLYFIVKYINVIVNVNENVARLFLMHAIGTSLSMWVFTIIRETADAIAELNAIAESDAENQTTRVTAPNETFEFAYNDCGKPNALNAIHRQFAPYLYPFVIEYCILVVGIWCKMYVNINRCPQKISNSNKVDIDALSNSYENSNSSTNHMSAYHDHSSEHDKNIENSYRLYADCRSSLRGIFLGLLLVIMAIVFISLIFVGYQNRLYLKTSIFINKIFECIVIVSLIFITLYAYTRTTKLNINPNPISNMDDVLLVIAMPAFFSDCIFTLVPMIQKGSVFPICISIFRVIQVLLQTPFIIDGKRRCSDEPYLQKKQIGRGFVIFLAIANMALWIYNTFSIKSTNLSDDRLLRTSTLEHFKPHLTSFNHVLSFSFIGLPSRNLEPRVRANAKASTINVDAHIQKYLS